MSHSTVDYWIQLVIFTLSHYLKKKKKASTRVPNGLPQFPQLFTNIYILYERQAKQKIEKRSKEQDNQQIHT